MECQSSPQRVCVASYATCELRQTIPKPHHYLLVAEKEIYVWSLCFQRQEDGPLGGFLGPLGALITTTLSSSEMLLPQFVSSVLSTTTA